MKKATLKLKATEPVPAIDWAAVDAAALSATPDADSPELTKAQADKLRPLAEVLPTLMEMSRTGAFGELHYWGVFDYCLRALSFSKEQSNYFKKVANEPCPCLCGKKFRKYGELSNVGPSGPHLS